MTEWRTQNLSRSYLVNKIKRQIPTLEKLASHAKIFSHFLLGIWHMAFNIFNIHHLCVKAHILVAGQETTWVDREKKFIHDAEMDKAVCIKSVLEDYDKSLLPPNVLHCTQCNIVLSSMPRVLSNIHSEPRKNEIEAWLAYSCDKPKCQKASCDTIQEPYMKRLRELEKIYKKEEFARTCRSCKKIEESGGKDSKMKQCSRCQRVYYCGQECQKGDWTLHKEFCKKVK